MNFIPNYPLEMVIPNNMPNNNNILNKINELENRIRRLEQRLANLENENNNYNYNEPDNTLYMI